MKNDRIENQIQLVKDTGLTSMFDLRMVQHIADAFGCRELAAYIETDTADYLRRVLAPLLKNYQSLTKEPKSDSKPISSLGSSGQEKNEQPIPRMVTLREAAKLTKLSYNYLRCLCNRNEIAYIMVGSKYLINLDKLIEKLNPTP